MEFLRKTANFISFYFLISVIVLAVGMVAVVSVLNAKTIESVLSEKQVYAQVVPSLLKTANQDTKSSQTSDIPLGEQWVKDVVTKAFPAQTIQGLSNAVLDGSFAWLGGETESVRFSYDLTTNKQALAEGVGQYVTKRSAGLPICGIKDLAALSQDINLYTAPCRPANISPTQAGEVAKQQILNSQDFLANPVITSDNLTGEKNKTSPFDTLKPVRTFYANRTLILAGFCLLALVFATTGVLTSPDRLRGLRRLSSVLFFTGLSLGVFTFMLSLGIKSVQQKASGEEIMTNVIFPVIDGLGHRAIFLYITMTITVFALSGIAYILNRYLQSHKPATTKPKKK